MLCWLFLYAFLNDLLLVEHLQIMIVHVLDLMLEIFNDIFHIPLSLRDTLRIIFDKLRHYFQHVLFIGILVDIVQLLDLDQALVVVITIFQFDDCEEVVFFEGSRVLLCVFVEVMVDLTRRLLCLK